MANYTSQYPPAQSDTYVKATASYAGFAFYLATDPAKSLTGTHNGNSWFGPDNAPAVRWHIDLGESKTIRRVYYENNHISGSNTEYGAKTYILFGSDSAASFAELTYATDTGWTQLTNGVFAQHAAADAPDPKYILVDNSTAYRYYAFKVADSYSVSYISMRRIELQTEDGWSGGGGSPILIRRRPI